MSPELKQEIQRRVAAGPYRTEEELLSRALRALDNEELLEREILKGLEGDDVEVTSEDWRESRQEALEILKAMKAK